jgi:hypothetical protein
MAHPLEPLPASAWTVPFPLSDALPEAPPGLPGLKELALQVAMQSSLRCTITSYRSTAIHRRLLAPQGRWREVATRCQTTSTSVTEVALAVSAYQVRLHRDPAQRCGAASGGGRPTSRPLAL